MCPGCPKLYAYGEVTGGRERQTGQLCRAGLLDGEKFVKISDRNLEIYTAPTKAKSREPAYSQALVPNKIDRQRVLRSDDYGGWCLELGRGGRYREKRLSQDRIC